MNNTGKYLGLKGRVLFDVVKKGVLFNRNRGIHADGPGWKCGCGKDVGTRFVHVGNESFFFGQKKISLDDSFDQSLKNNMKFGEVVLQTQLGCRWMATANRSTAFFCLHRLDVWNPPQVGCSGCWVFPDSARKMRRTRTWKTSSTEKWWGVLLADFWGRFLYLSKHLKQT